MSLIYNVICASIIIAQGSEGNYMIKIGFKLYFLK